MYLKVIFSFEQWQPSASYSCLPPNFQLILMLKSSEMTMKNRYNFLFVLNLIFLNSLSISSKAQDSQQLKQILSATNQTELERLASEFENQYKANFARAMELAGKNNWPLEREVPNGGWMRLDGVDELGMPIYVGSENRNAAISIGTDKIRHIGGLPNYNLGGQGYIPRVWDGGGVRRTHQEFENEKVINVDAPNTTTWSEHATHVTGTVLAIGKNASARGMANLAKGRCFNSANDDSEMASQANQGSFISNHSYGARAGWDFGGSYIWHGGANDLVDFKNGHYNAKCRAWDLIMNNAPYYLICKSAGNSRGLGAPQGTTYNLASGGTSNIFRPANGPYDCLQTYANAKNILLVGAVNRVNNGYTTPNSVGMSSFSSWGPTDDGRIKPDVVGQGVNVSSSTATSNTSYGSLSGTSMSAPTATGTGVLLQEFYANTHAGRLMRASTLRGLFIHTADECGQNPGPDFAFGWGLINARKAADLIRNDSLTSLLLELPLANNQVIEKELMFAAGAPVTASICWNDPASIVGPAVVDDRTPKLVNDLDLRIVHISSGDTIYPWKLNFAVPTAAAAKGDNRLDNVERIDFTPTVSGAYKLIISHKGTLNNANPQIVSFLVSGIEDATASTCRGTTKFVSPFGVFNDGSDAAANYGSMGDCKWILNPADTNTIISISFSRFNVQPGDTLIVRMGKIASSPIFAKLSGSQIPQTFLVPGGSAFLHFITDASVASSGWQINYSAIQLPAGTITTQSASFCDGVQNRFALDVAGRDTTGYRFNWSFPGGTPSASTLPNPLVTYAQPGSFAVSLALTNSAGALDLSIIDFVQVLRSGPAVSNGLFDGFETDSFPVYPWSGGASWRISGTSGPNNWQRSADAAFHGSSCLMAPNRPTNLGVRTIFSPQFDYTPLEGNLKFSFRYSFAKTATNNIDVLQVFTSFDCGRTWTLRKTRSAAGTGVNGLATIPGVINIPGPYAPFGEDEWALDSIMLNLGNARANVMFRFDITAGGGHPIYIDNVRFNSDLITNLFSASTSIGAKVYPNPNEGKFLIKLPASQTAKATLFDNLGREMLVQQLQGETNFISTQLKSGVYLLKIETANAVEVKKLTVQ